MKMHLFVNFGIAVIFFGGVIINISFEQLLQNFATKKDFNNSQQPSSNTKQKST